MISVDIATGLNSCFLNINIFNKSIFGEMWVLYGLGLSLVSNNFNAENVEIFVSVRVFDKVFRQIMTVI